MSSPTASGKKSAAPSPGCAEAARYALLRRLAPAMRHHLVVNLQPIGMIYDVMDRRLQTSKPDWHHVQDGITKINRFVRAALDSCLDVVSWLAPEADATTTVSEGARECFGLLATGLSFRGFTLRNEVAALPGEVRRSAIRNLLTASLLHCTDQFEPPADLVLSAQAQPAGACLRLSLQRQAGESNFPTDITYRELCGSDLEALAASENVTLWYEDDPRALCLLLPWASSPAN